jgi:D-glycero-D-manno-heptose 1,7-bisphosphate phosphatase
VLLPDEHPILTPADVQLLDGVGRALAALKAAGLLLVVVTNQAAVARGLLTESQLAEVHNELNHQLRAAGGPALDAVYFCPHHPHADQVAYRLVCECRKPRAGMLLRAAGEHQLHLPACFLVGDRMTDVLAGARAGCRTVLLNGPRTADPPIVTAEPPDPNCTPDYSCPDLASAVRWILAAC